eukprot:8820921-Alexandrium_andersonii.AAC.1
MWHTLARGKDTPMTDDPGHDVVGRMLELSDALHPPIQHGVAEHPVPSTSSEANAPSNGGAVKGESSNNVPLGKRST